MSIVSRTTGIICALAAIIGLAQPAMARSGRVSGPNMATARYGLISSRNLRIGPVVVARGGAIRSGYSSFADMVRPRFTPGMIDIYPSAGSGFRLSIGNRYFNKINYTAAAEQATHGLLYDPHMIRNGIGLQRAFRRYTPAIAVGYDLQVAPRLVMGLEGGVLKGRAINPGPRGGILRADAERKAYGGGLNPITTFAVRFAF